VLDVIWLVIELGRDNLPTNIFTKFDDYTMKTIEVIERVPIIRPVFSNSV